MCSRLWVSAAFTAAVTRSSSIAVSAGSIALGSILIDLMSWVPVATTVTRPSPALPSTVSSASAFLRSSMSLGSLLALGVEGVGGLYRVDGGAPAIELGEGGALPGGWAGEVVVVVRGG